MKVETLTEVANRLYPIKETIELLEKESFIKGGKWVEENIPIRIEDLENTYVHIEDGVVIVEKLNKDIVTYTEEEVLDILYKYTEYFGGFGERVSLTEWFDKHKKK